MKQYKFLSTALFLAAMVAWSGCSNEDESAGNVRHGGACYKCV